MANFQSTRTVKFPQSYHLAWLKAHPERTLEWLQDKTRDGFHVHHVDGDHANDDPSNLVLMDGVDHMRMHGFKLKDGIVRWRAKPRNAAFAKQSEANAAEGAKLYDLKATWGCTWAELAKRYLQGADLSGRVSATYAGNRLFKKAMRYAQLSGKPWPPSHDRTITARPPTELEIQVMRHRQRSAVPMALQD